MKYISTLILLLLVGCAPYHEVKVNSLISADYKQRDDYHYTLQTQKKTPLTFKEEIIYSRIFNSIGESFPGYTPASKNTDNYYYKLVQIGVEYVDNDENRKSFLGNLRDIYRKIRGQG